MRYFFKSIFFCFFFWSCLFSLFMYNMFVYIRFMLSLCFEHVMMLDLSLYVFFCFSVSGLGFRACLCAHVSYMPTQAWSMHKQAYVCTRMLVPINPNSHFLLLFLLLFHIICLCFNLLVCFWVYVSLFTCLFLFNMMD